MLSRILRVALAVALMLACLLPILAAAEPVSLATACDTSPPLAVIVPAPGTLESPEVRPWNVTKRAPPSILARGDLEQVAGRTTKEPATVRLE